MKIRWLKIVAVLCALVMFASACGSDGDTSTATGETGTTETSEVETTETETAAEPTDVPEVIEAGSEAAEEVDTVIEEDTTESVYGGQLTVGLEAEAVGLRPWEDTCSSPCYNMMITVYDKLAEQDTSGAYHGYLAESMVPNADFTEWVVTLRPDVTFHNGKALTAQSVADMFPIQQEGAAAAGQVSASNLSDVQATGDLEITYTLSAANSAFPAYLSRAPLGMVFDAEAAAADPVAYSTAPIGTGPFQIVSRDLDNETIMERNESYWLSDPDGNQLPYLDSIAFRPIPDEGTRLDALLSGTVDAMHTLRQGTIRDARLARDGGEDLNLLEFQGNNVGGGMFNMAVPPYDDVRVRRGLTMMNSQEQVIDALGGTGISLPGTQWFSPDSPFYSEKVAAAWPQFDFNAGAEMLAGYIDDPERSDGKSAGEPIDIELSCPPDPSLIAAMQVLETTWSATGSVNVNLTAYDQQTHINYALGGGNGFLGEHGAHCWRWSSDDDPSVTINPFLAPYSEEHAASVGLDGIVSPLNFPNYWNGEAFGEAVAALATADIEERKALYEGIMLKIAEDVPIWYSGHTATMIGTSSAVSGINGWHLPTGELGIGFPNAEGRWAEVSLASG